MAEKSAAVSAPTAEAEKIHEKPVGTKHATPATAVEDDDEDEDIDALIDDLQSEDGGAVLDDEEEDAATGPRPIPDDLLQTDPRVGLTDQEVLTRRKRFGMNMLSKFYCHHQLMCFTKGL